MTKDPERQYTELLLWSWGHDIRGRAATIKDLLYLIRRRLAEPSFNLGSVHSLLDKIERISEEIGTKTPSPLELEQVSLNLLISERVNRWETIETHYPVEFQVDLDLNQPVVDANPCWLGRVLDILIENAVEATRESERQLIRVAVQAHVARVALTIRDTGKGIDRALLLTLLRKSLALPGGRGRGLYIARLALEIYGGTVEVADTTPTGTTMRIWLPLSGGGTENA